MPLTVSRKQRDAIYELVVDHLSGIGDVAATGRSVRFVGVNFFRIADEKIAEIWNVRYDLGLREQIGAPVYAGYSDDSEA